MGTIEGTITGSEGSEGTPEEARQEEESRVVTSGLVYIGRIIKIEPIPDADRILLATVVCGKGGKWMGIVPIGQYHEDELCTVYLQDSLLPDIPIFDFMDKYKHRVRMQRFKGVPSECLIMPLEFRGITGSRDIGTDITAEAFVTKYEKLLPAGMRGYTVGNFPSFIPKTDEVNFQRAGKLVNALRGTAFYATEKADGTSTTAYRRGDHVGVCSRNWEKKEAGGTSYWITANKYGIKEKLPDNVALQWETVGPGIQKNPLGLSELEARAFDVYFIDEYRYGTWEELLSLADFVEMPTAKLVENKIIFDMTDEEIRKYAEGKYLNGKQREGVVFRACDERGTKKITNGERLSFKSINLKYKD